MRSKGRLVWAVAGCLLLPAVPAIVHGQAISRSGDASLVAPGTSAGPNVLDHPALNPFWNANPSQQYDRQALAFYFLSTQRARGGIGSGQLSGLHSPAVTGRGRAGGRPPAEMPRASTIPGGGAAGYFGRASGSSSTIAPYFQRQDRFFSNNGR